MESINGSISDEDVFGCLEVIFNSEQGELLQIDAVKWLQGIVRANQQARDLIMGLSFVEKVIGVLQSDPSVYPASVKV